MSLKSPAFTHKNLNGHPVRTPKITSVITPPFPKSYITFCFLEHFILPGTNVFLSVSLEHLNLPGGTI